MNTVEIKTMGDAASQYRFSGLDQTLSTIPVKSVTNTEKGVKVYANTNQMLPSPFVKDEGGQYILMQTQASTAPSVLNERVMNFSDWASKKRK